MSSFFLSDTKVLTELELTDQEYRIYQYCCRQFNVKTLSCFIRLVDIAGQFQIPLLQVQEALDKMTRIKIDDLQLIKIRDAGKYLEFDMPRHKHFIKQVGFTKFGSSKGWSALKGHVQQFTQKKYLFPNLDQHELFDKLSDLSDEDFNKVKVDDLKYQWVYKNVKRYRTSS